MFLFTLCHKDHKTIFYLHQLVLCTEHKIYNHYTANYTVLYEAPSLMSFPNKWDGLILKIKQI